MYTSVHALGCLIKHARKITKDLDLLARKNQLPDQMKYCYKTTRTNNTYLFPHRENIVFHPKDQIHLFSQLFELTTTFTPVLVAFCKTEMALSTVRCFHYPSFHHRKKSHMSCQSLDISISLIIKVCGLTLYKGKTLFGKAVRLCINQRFSFIFIHSCFSRYHISTNSVAPPFNGGHSVDQFKFFCSNRLILTISISKSGFNNMENCASYIAS